MISAHKITEALRTVSIQDRAIGYLRYEALRKLNVRQYQELRDESLKGRLTFDDLVDELIEKEEAWKANNPGPK